jgi:hypothetical protein
MSFCYILLLVITINTNNTLNSGQVIKDNSHYYFITTSLFEKADKGNQRDIPKNFTMPISSGDGE